MPKISFDTWLAILGIALGTLQYFLAKSGKSTALVDVLLLAGMAGLLAYASLSLPWVQSAPGTALKIWRAGLIIFAIVFATARFGIWTWPKPQTDNQVFANQLNRLQEVQEFFEGKTEYELREIFDLNNMAKYNLKGALIDQRPQQFTQQAIDEVRGFFRGGNYNLSLRYIQVLSMGDADHSPMLREIPGKAYRIYCSVKYLQARRQLQRLASFTEMPSPIRDKLNSFSEALDKNLDILLDLINQDLEENPDRLAYNDDSKSTYAGAATNTYNKVSVQLKPLSDEVTAEIRKYLKIQ